MARARVQTVARVQTAAAAHARAVRPDPRCVVLMHAEAHATPPWVVSRVRCSAGEQSHTCSCSWGARIHGTVSTSLQHGQDMRLISS